MTTSLKKKVRKKGLLAPPKKSKLHEKSGFWSISLSVYVDVHEYKDMCMYIHTLTYVGCTMHAQDLEEIVGDVDMDKHVVVNDLKDQVISAYMYICMYIMTSRIRSFPHVCTYVRMYVYMYMHL